MFDITDPIFQDADKARQYLEDVRWPDGPFCPHCGEAENVHAIKARKGSKTRPGVYQCNSCRQQFTVTVGTVFERSKVPLNKWLAAFFLLSSSKKGISAHQIHRMLKLTYKTAWFMCHRIREAMKDESTDPLGGAGQHVEVDETFIGQAGYEEVGLMRYKKKGVGDRRVVLALVERNGRARTFHVENIKANTLRAYIVENIDRASRLQTDEGRQYIRTGREFKGGHGTVIHEKKQYAKGVDHTNTVEGYFSIFKRGMKGVYQHCGEQHLQRYLTEFDFRYSNRVALGVDDTARMDKALKGAEGKRLTYRRPRNRANV